MILWRIATETREPPADDLSGAGAAVRPGRWNEEGQRVVYAAQTLALAVLETAAHLEDEDRLPLNRFVVRIEVPDDIWRRCDEFRLADLPPAWCAIPAGRASVEAGAQWLNGRRSALLRVPSVLVPEECAVLVNPFHPDAAHLCARAARRFEYNRLFRRP